MKLTKDELDRDKMVIIQGWKQFIDGNFFIERALKKYAIFIKIRDRRCFWST